MTKFVSKGACFFLLCHGLQAAGRYFVSMVVADAESALLLFAFPHAQVFPPSTVAKASVDPLALPVVIVIVSVPVG